MRGELRLYPCPTVALMDTPLEHKTKSIYLRHRLEELRDEGKLLQAETLFSSKETYQSQSR